MKDKLRVFTVTFLICVLVLANNVHAFTSLNYYDHQIINVGLESMKNTQLTITFSGNYTFNGTSYQSGTSYLLKVSGSQVSFNGGLYDNISFEPTVNTNTIKIASTSSLSYLGTLVFKVDTTTAQLMPINTVYIEDYLKGVVGEEMSDYFPIEALKAQAIAARNFALANIAKHSTKRGYNVCDTTDCQVYRGYRPSYTRVITAVNATKGMLLLSGTSIVEALYSASDGGYTEASENVWNEARSYFKATADDYDVDYSWVQKYNTAAIEALIKSKLYLQIVASDTFVGIDLNSITKFESGRIKNITLIFKNQFGVQFTKSYAKDNARTFLSLKSALYNVTYDAASDIYTFNGKGNGHGIGMSQIGAQHRGNGGQTFDTILKFYYAGTNIAKAISSIDSMAVDKDKIYSFDYPSFTVNATGGSGKGFLYEYIIQHNNVTLYDSGFIYSSTFKYKPREAGSYNLVVYVKDSASILPYEDTKTYNFNVEPSAQEDINLDKIVDIYDLVIASKNMGKQRDVAIDWNERWNVDDSDNIINILDLAKISKNYNLKY